MSEYIFHHREDFEIAACKHFSPCDDAMLKQIRRYSNFLIFPLKVNAFELSKHYDWLYCFPNFNYFIPEDKFRYENGKMVYDEKDVIKIDLADYVYKGHEAGFFPASVPSLNKDFSPPPAMAQTEQPKGGSK
jgi:hypothetical protein